MLDSSSPIPINKEEFSKIYRTRVFAGASILFGGLVLIFFSGCFLIGILVLLRPAIFFENNAGVNEMSADLTLSIVLYAMSFICFLSGLVLLGKGFSSLSRAISERP